MPAVRTREVINSVGAGDALLAAFVHAYKQTADPYQSLAKAVVFASYKIGEDGGSRGFLDGLALDRLYAEIQGGLVWQEPDSKE
jgi:ribokinase